MDDKKVVALATTSEVESTALHPGELEYTEEEVTRARRKVDFRVLPLVVLMFCFLQFDRSNIGNALTDTLAKDVGINTSDINLGQTIFTLGIFALELPSNIVAQRWGPQKWIPLLEIAWGAVTMGQAAMRSRSGFLTTRFLLAAFEAGFIPGMAWYLTGLYRTKELAFRLAIFWSANSIAGMVSGVLALGLLSAGSGSHLDGWQVLFLTEGGGTILVAILGGLLLPASVFDSDRPGRSLVGRVVFSERDAAVLAAALTHEDPRMLTRATQRATPKDIRDTLLDWRIYVHVISAFLSSVMFTPFNTYGPSLVKSLGYKGYTANGMVAPGSALALIFSFLLAYFSDRTRERALFIAVAMLASGAGCLWLALPPVGTPKGVLYAGYLATVGTMGSAQGINAAWLSSRMPERKRPIALALYVMGIQLAGFAGSNIFKANDAPRYRHGLTICAGCVFAGAVVVLLGKLAYAWDDKEKPAHEKGLQ